MKKDFEIHVDGGYFDNKETGKCNYTRTFYYLSEIRRQDLDDIVEMVEGMKRQWKHEECELGKNEPCEICVARLTYNRGLTDIINKLGKYKGVV